MFLRNIRNVLLSRVMNLHGPPKAECGLYRGGSSPPEADGCLPLIFFLLILFLLSCFVNEAGTQEPPIKKITLSELRDLLGGARGKVIIMDFWATTSRASRQAMPFLGKLHEDYKDKGLVVIGVTVEGVGEEVIRPFVKMLGVKYPIFFGGDDIIEAYDIQYVPITYLLDREGKVGLKEPGFNKDTPERLRRKVEELIKIAP
jgi:thiol-disulfide isomerase/thioredoxin